MILVIGASGMLGSAVTRLLHDYNLPVKATTRKASKLQNLAASGVEIVEANLVDEGSMLRALEGVNTVVAAAHSLLGTGKYKLNRVDEVSMIRLIDQCRTRGIKHFIYISVVNASDKSSSEFLRAKHKVEQHLVNSGLSYTIIRPTAFMDFHAHKMIGQPIIKSSKVRIIGDGVYIHNFVAVTDVAKLVVEIIRNPAPAQNKLLHIAGPDVVNKKQVAELYASALGKQVKVSHISNKTLKLMSRVFKPFHSGLSNMFMMAAALDEQDMTVDMGETYKLYPLYLTSLKEFINSKV